MVLTPHQTALDFGKIPSACREQNDTGYIMKTVTNKLIKSSSVIGRCKSLGVCDET